MIMKKTLSFVLFVLFFIRTLDTIAQYDTGKRANIGLYPPISTNWHHAALDTNVVSFNLISGLSSAETAFCLAGIRNDIRSYMQGVAIAGIDNQIGGDVNGVCIAGIRNQYRGGRGVALAGMANISEGEISQFAGISNKAGALRGVQVAGIINQSANLEGVQLSGIVNMTKEARGLQLTGIFNTCDSGATQVAGLVNRSGGATRFQLAGGVNCASTLNGMQIGGLVNVAKKVNGVQLGFINIADTADTQIGLINISRNGEKCLRLSVDEHASMLVSFRSGGRIYGILGLGYNLKNKREKYLYQAGLGASLIPGNTFRFSTELTTLGMEGFKKTSTTFISGLRLMPSLRLSKQVELLAGPSFNLLMSDSDEGKALQKHFLHKWYGQEKDHLYGFYIGYFAGIQFHL